MFAPSECELAVPAVTSGVAQRSSLAAPQSTFLQSTCASGASSERAIDYPSVSTNQNTSDLKETKPDDENIYVQQYFELLNVSGKFKN